MARDYVKRTPAKPKARLPQKLLIVIIIYVAGYLTASLITQERLKEAYQKFTMHHAAKPTTHAKPQTEVKVIKKPKPKFEFYTLLAKEHTQALNKPSAAHPSIEHTAKAPEAPKVLNNQKPVLNHAPSLTQDTYMIQVAAFARRVDAEQVKAGLVLKGFDVNIVAINKRNLTWHRVMIGPFTNKNEAQKVQVTLARIEHLNGMIRKMNG